MSITENEPVLVCGVWGSPWSVPCEATYAKFPDTATEYAPNRLVASRSVPTTVGWLGFEMSTMVRLFPDPSLLLPLPQAGTGPGTHGPLRFLLVTNA